MPAPAQDDSWQREIENGMDAYQEDDLAEAMNNTSVASPAPVTGLPAHLARHAAEFWFPECRDCACCNGFKHGCPCVATNNGQCTCAGKGEGLPAGAAAPSGGAKPVCKFFLSSGGCRFGDGCRFSHEK